MPDQAFDSRFLDALIEAGELAGLVGQGEPQPDFLLLDARDPERYAAGHIPGALGVDRKDFDDRESQVDGIIARPRQLAAHLGSLGIANDTRLVVYDEDFGYYAAHLWWILKVNGHGPARVLNGGLNAWQAAGLPLTVDQPARRPPCRYSEGGVDESIVIETEAVRQRHRQPGVVVVDTRSKPEYLSKQGRIPGSVNVNYIRNFNKATYRLKTAAELRAVYAEKGITPDKEIVLFCNTCVRSAQTFLTLKLLGYPRVQNYNGSWAAWTDAGLPVEREEDASATA